jgi:hypothetical protein
VTSVPAAMNVAAHDLRPPGQEQDETKLVNYVLDKCYRSSPLYASDFSGFRKAELYDQSEQWLRQAHTTRDSRYPTQWVRINYQSGDPNAIPLPVYNEMVALRENESARLGRPEYKPRVRPRAENPGITEKEGAKSAERALQHRMSQIPWDQVEEQACYNMPMYGGTYLFGRWEQTWMDTVRVPEKSVACSRNPRVSGPEQQGAEAGAVPLGGEAGPASGSVQTMAGPATEASLGVGDMMPPCPYVDTEENAQSQGVAAGGPCPLCGSPVVPYQPTLEEAQGALGKDWPKGDWTVRIPWPYEIFVRDAGVGVDRSDIDEWVYVHVETLDWVAERWPDKVRDLKTGALKIHPEHPASLMVENPTFGAPPIFQAAQRTAVFRNHCLVYEYFRKPWLAWNAELKQYTRNHGRYTVVVQKRVCEDTDLEVQSFNQPGRWVARARLEFVHWEPKEGGRRSTVGQSLWDRLYDAQDGINERMAQVRAVNQRGALPWYLQARGRNFETRAADAAVPFRRVMVDIDPTDRHLPLTLMQNTTIDQGVYAEIETSRNFAQRVSGQVEVEQGQVPPGVSAATAIAYLKTESGEKRRPRIKRLRQGMVRTWQHGLELMAGLYIEPREYSYEDDSAEERWAFIHGEVIASSNPKVDIYPTPDYDQRDAERESIRDMVTLGILDPKQTPQINRKIVHALEPSLEFFVDDDLQEDQAQREWRDFKEYGKVPVIDPSLDDPATHFSEHGRACFGAWFRGEEAKAGWDEILTFIGADWDRSLTALAFQRQPGTSLQTTVYFFWMQQIQAAMVQGLFRGPQDQRSLQNVLHWRAHMEAHKLLMLLQSVQMAGAPEAPGQGSSPEPTSERPAATGVPGGPA